MTLFSNLFVIIGRQAQREMNGDLSRDIIVVLWTERCQINELTHEGKGDMGCRVCVFVWRENNLLQRIGFFWVNILKKLIEFFEL